MSQNVPDNEQGLLQGTVTSVNTISMIIGPLFATQIFALSTGPRPLFELSGTFYFFGAGCFVVALIILYLDNKRRQQRLKTDTV